MLLCNLGYGPFRPNRGDLGHWGHLICIDGSAGR